MPKQGKVYNLRNEQGGQVVDDLTPVTGSWAVFQVIEDAVLAAITMPKVDNSDALVGPTFPQGFILYGGITGLELASGTVMLMNYVDPTIRSSQESM